jgi:hypothetical protein
VPDESPPGGFAPSSLVEAVPPTDALSGAPELPGASDTLDGPGEGWVGEGGSEDGGAVTVVLSEGLVEAPGRGVTEGTTVGAG